jgi:hypothetical protein
MKNITLFSIIVAASFLLFSCNTSTETEEADPIFPAYVDKNDNNINDYVEQATHDPGPGTVSSKSSTDNGSNSHGEPGHSFTDANEDGICDYAQDGSPSWHGPGFIDENSNGICDYWDESHSMHSRHNGMRFHDENENHINDYMEEENHWGEHEFVDADEDGICDLAQDGSPTWHGPGFVDKNGNGMSDHWENGGRGHGGMMGGGHN